MTVLSFGEVLFDVYPDRACLGGAPLNFAAHVARHGHRAVMLSAVGDDSLGAEAIRQTAEWGVDTSCITVYPDRPTGTCTVTLDAQSVPSYRLAEDTAWDAVTTDAVDADGEVLYFGTLALRASANREALAALLSRKSFDEVFVDLNLRPPFYSEETVRFALERATTVKISDEELPTVQALLRTECVSDPETALRKLAALYPQVRLWLLTCGAQGACTWECAQERFTWADAVSATVVSTVGAGDSFAAAFLSQFRRGRSMEDSLHHAAAVAALVVSRTEAVPLYDPTALSD